MPPKPFQFDLRSIFWLMLTLGMTFAYLQQRWLDNWRLAAVYAAAAVIAGGVIGGLAGQVTEGLYWSSLITLFAFLSVHGGQLNDRAVAVGWGLVGACCGGVAGTNLLRRRIPNALLSVLLGLALMAASVVLGGETIVGTVLFDVICAGVVGLLLPIFTELLHWFESRSQQPRAVTSAWLTLAVLIGSWLSRRN